MFANPSAVNPEKLLKKTFRAILFGTTKLAMLFTIINKDVLNKPL